MALTVLAVLVLPGGAAAAQTYVVNTTDFSGGEPGCGLGEECTLRKAIELANDDGEATEIVFGVAGAFKPEIESLPGITSPVTLDATTAPGYAGAGHPVVELDGESEGFLSTGFKIEPGGSGSTIEGFDIHTFATGIRIEGDENLICGNYIGTDPSGETAEPNEVGIRVAFATPFYAGNRIGSKCGAGNGNPISGNEVFGIVDEGEGTLIRRNLIGSDAGGTEAIANGFAPQASEPAGGILAWGKGGVIGGVEAGEGNTIAFNEASAEFTPGVFNGGGVVVRADNAVSIRGNSIFDNEGTGIDYNSVPPVLPPTIEGAESTETVSSILTGSVSAGASEAIDLDFFANAQCDAGGAGEGKTYLGSATVSTDGGGLGKFKATLPVQPKGTVLTATATRQVAGGTTEFSTCFTAPQPGPAPPKPPTPPIPGTPIAKVVPSNGESVAVAPKAGVVFVQRPGQKKPTPLKEGQTIPVGSVVDATKGKVTLTSVNAAGEEQTADFYGGKFVVLQHDGSGLVILKLRGGNFGSCKGAKGSGAGATASGRSGRRLWGSGKGNFRTEGNHGSATVRGTIWFTEDRCTSTFFKVKRGVVSIRDFDAGKTFSLPAGKSYLAKP